METRERWQARLKSIEREFLVAQAALGFYSLAADKDPRILPPELKPSDVKYAISQTSATFLIRLFAEFESGLREYHSQLRRTQPLTKHLLNLIASRRAVPASLLEATQQLREDRNFVVHASGKKPLNLDFLHARETCSKFLGFLPFKW